MAYSLVSPNTFALNLKLHCKICEKTLKNMLLKIQGVHSVKIDEKLGNVVISGTVDPHHQFDQFDHSNGGEFCAASSSCCGGHAAINQSHNLHGCCHGGNTSNFGSCCANSRNCCCEHRPAPTENWGRARPSNSQPPPLLTAQSWSSGSSIASAPPLPSDYFQGPPSPPSSSSQMLNTCYSALSDENANGCMVHDVQTPLLSHCTEYRDSGKNVK